MDTVNTQLGRQFAELIKKENKTVQELRDEFFGDLKKNKYWRENKKNLALMEIASKWMMQNRLSYFLLPKSNIKVPSSNETEDYSFFNQTFNEQVREIIKKNFSIVFVDTAVIMDHPMAFTVFERRLHSNNEEAYPARKRTDEFIKGPEFYHGIKFIIGTSSPNQTVLDIFNQKRKEKQEEIFSVCLDPHRKDGTKEYPWFDNYPQALGRRGKKFEHRFVPTAPIYPTEKIVRSACNVEYLSEKIKNALRFYQRDGQGKNWFERNGMPLENYFKVDEKAQPEIDKDGYPVPSEKAVMSKAAEEELTRLELAMEEL